MQGPSDAVATHPRREKLSAYERAQIYLAKKHEQEALGGANHHRRGLSGHFEDSSEAGDSTEEQRKEIPAMLNSGAHLHHMISTETSRASTHGSSDLLQTWGTEGRWFSASASEYLRLLEGGEVAGWLAGGDMKRGGLDVEGGYPDLDKLPGDLEDDKVECCEEEKRKNRFSKVKKVLKSKLGRSKSRQGMCNSGSEHGSEGPTEGAIKDDPHGIHSSG